MALRRTFLSHILCAIPLWLAVACDGQSESVRMTFIGVRHFESQNSPLYQCHLSAPDESAQVISFRKVSTRNGDRNNNPPPTAVFTTDYAFHHWRVELNNNDNNDAFGVFGCRATIPGRMDTDISGIFMRSNADVIPDDDLFTKTVNVGDTGVIVTMKTTGSKAVSNFRWLKDNQRNSDMDGLDTWNISRPVTVNDAGVYECHIDTERNQAKQGLMLLIVRACEVNKWGPPDCSKDCTHCFNGGICNEITGNCICAPGFAGTNCENACGGNRHGFSCNDDRCSSNPADNKGGCRHFLFCLPHPFGCRCNTGWKGLACNEACIAGTYGASCLQTCHCQSNQCNRYTGECTGSPTGCSDGWTGSNCQRECDQGYFGADCLGTCHCAQSGPCNRFTGECISGGCSSGWTGPFCQDECNQGSFGADCLGTCHCLSGPCDRFTGECSSSGCSAGWTGPYCQGVCPAPQFGLDCVDKCYCQNSTCDHIIGCTSRCNAEWASLYSANCRIGIIDNGYTKQNPEVAVPVTCTINKDNGGNHNQLDLLLSRQEIILDDSGITVNETTENGTARTIKFMVHVVSDGASLYCQLRKNGSRKAVLDLTIDLYDLPGLQSAPTKEFVDNSSVTISWIAWNDVSDHGDPPVVGYVPFYYHPSADDWIRGTYIAAVDNLTHAFTFRDLDSDTRYTFAVAAVRDGEGGEGPKSPNITIKTICAAPVRGPTDVETFITGDRQELVEISWKNPSVADINCDSGVSKFTVYYSSSSANETQEILNPDDTTVIFEDLVVGNTYSFQVKLTTEGGESRWSNRVDHLIPILPSLRNPPKVNYSCGPEVTITWNGWTEGEDEGTPPVIGYIPYHKLARNEQWIPSSFVHHEGNTFPMSFTFQDLSVSVFYSFALSVVREGDGGEGDIGEIVSHETSHCEPGLPIGIIIGSIFGGLLLMLLSLLVIFLIKKRRSQKRRPSEEQKNIKTVEGLELEPDYAYGNPGSSDHEGKQCNAEINEYLYEVPSVNLNSDNLIKRSGKGSGISDAEYKAESNSIQDYEDTLNNGLSPRHPMNVAPFVEFMRSTTAVERIMSDFKNLDVLPTKQIQLATGALLDNRNKNRFPDVIPMNNYRTPLKSVSLKGGNDYVNACMVTIGNVHPSVIMTQAPLPETVEDFWRLVFDYKCQTIIMLNEENSKDPTIVKYWPDLDDIQFGAMTVSTTLFERKSTYSIHHFEVSHRSCRESIHVEQFAFHNWPDQDGNLSALVNFICEIGFGRMRSQPTILHCSDGAGRSGIYAVATAEIERIQTDNTIEVFDTLRALRKQNPFAIIKQDDYLMCHRLLEFYITEMQEYGVIE